MIGLAGVPASFVKVIELQKKVPTRIGAAGADQALVKIIGIIKRMIDPDIFVWLGRPDPITQTETHRAATIVADRLCGSVANPIIRNAQEKRQLALIKTWLEERGYRQLQSAEGIKYGTMPVGTFGFRMNIPVKLEGGLLEINIPIDVAVKPKEANKDDMPILIEAKSAGDFANTNKRRKEEAIKMSQLRATYGFNVSFNLFLCGYFDSPYLGYEAAEGIDWVWEHRIEDLAQLGI